MLKYLRLFSFDVETTAMDNILLERDFIAELLSGMKGCIAEPHNCHARIEFRKT